MIMIIALLEIKVAKEEKLKFSRHVASFVEIS